MTEETAKQLIEAMNRLASAIQTLTGGAGTLTPGINVYHHSLPQWPVNMGVPMHNGGGYQNPGPQNGNLR